MRPWERWRYPYTLGLPGAALAVPFSVYILAETPFETIGLVLLGGALLVAALVGLFHWRYGEEVSMWRRHDESVSRHDRNWWPRRPSVDRTELGFVVTVRPVPALSEEVLRKALDEIAQTYGCRYVSHEIVLPHGFRRRSVGRERLRWEMAR
jgi:hypothetical protein